MRGTVADGVACLKCDYPWKSIHLIILNYPKVVLIRGVSRVSGDFLDRMCIYIYIIYIYIFLANQTEKKFATSESSQCLGPNVERPRQDSAVSWDQIGVLDVLLKFLPSFMGHLDGWMKLTFLSFKLQNQKNGMNDDPQCLCLKLSCFFLRSTDFNGKTLLFSYLFLAFNGATRLFRWLHRCHCRVYCCLLRRPVGADLGECDGHRLSAFGLSWSWNRVKPLIYRMWYFRLCEVFLQVVFCRNVCWILLNYGTL